MLTQKDYCFTCNIAEVPFNVPMECNLDYIPSQIVIFRANSSKIGFAACRKERFRLLADISAQKHPNFSTYPHKRRGYPQNDSVLSTIE